MLVIFVIFIDYNVNMLMIFYMYWNKFIYSFIIKRSRDVNNSWTKKNNNTYIIYLNPIHNNLVKPSFRVSPDLN